ncbi:hypothetical protein Scep_001086 [Stephania cephalantha]|uniref:SWIB domain-containing protein n=1 Tax=Stephania cephalantha TaxID=152367 RepID=A0AAP0Q3H1_9MAGN
MATSVGCRCWSSFVSFASAAEAAKSSHTLAFSAHGNLRAARFATSAASAKSSATAATTEKRPLRGIMKPKPISPAMQELLGVPEIPRTQALKQIWAYIKEHNLQQLLEDAFIPLLQSMSFLPSATDLLFFWDPENKKIIVCDEKLKKIFGGRDRVGFLEVSGLINPHFMK